MLTAEHAIVVFERGRAVPDRLDRGQHGHYLGLAGKLLTVYRTGAGRTRRELHRSVEGIFADEAGCPLRRIRAFCKLLDDAAGFRTDPRGKAAELRLRVFRLAAGCHPLVRHADRMFDFQEQEVKERIASEIGRRWEDIAGELYADVIDLQTMESFPGYAGPEELLSRYNVAQLQACLYRAERVSLLVSRDLKTVLRHAKLAGLMHEIVRLGPSKYRMELSGPASVLSTTRRYGVSFARFLPALLACRGWSLRALVRTPWRGRAELRLSSRDGYRSHLPAPAEFDSTVEEAFARKFGQQRDGWKLERESEIVHRGQQAFFPDFVFRHEDGTEVMLEIVGFWTPEYLETKRELLRRLRPARLLVAVAEKSLRRGARVPEGFLVYKTRLKIAPVLEALERAREDFCGST
jgi:predicted nuclease of restriction endonuclease-like RecB superfamily